MTSQSSSELSETVKGVRSDPARQSTAHKCTGKTIWTSAGSKQVHRPTRRISGDTGNRFKMGQSSSNPLIPREYKVLEDLGSGSFGVVVKCLKKNTKEIVALKIPRKCILDNELAIMTFFKRHDLDRWNIVRFVGPVTLTDNCTALAYESLDVTLGNYLNANNTLNVGDVRSVVQQLASALHALKSVKVIHADMKFDNIMLVDRKAQPLRVKLIDFGLALPSSSAKQGQRRQMLRYRAPEIFLGLPYSESIDMWSLGVVMARLLLRRVIFPGMSTYSVMHHIVDFLGVPPDHLLTAGKYSKKYFVRGQENGEWRLKTYEEFGGLWQAPDNGRFCRINRPDCLERGTMGHLNMVEAAEKRECIDLVKAMLQMDSSERITPSQVLSHPFIRRGNLHQGSDSMHEASAQPPQTPYGTSIEYRSRLGYDSKRHKPDSAEIPPGVILVQPAPPECCLALDEDNRQGETSGSRCEASAPPPQTPAISTWMECKSWLGYDSECHKPDSAEIPPGVILVQPAPPECCVALDEDSRQGETSGSRPEASAPAPQTPAISTWMECKSWLGYDSECHKPDPAEIPPGVILVQPAPPECCVALDEDNRQSETSGSRPEASAPAPQTPAISTWMECKSWLGYDSECHKSDSAEIPPGVILVQPAPPECCVALDEDSRQGETSGSRREASAPAPQTASVSKSFGYKSWSGCDSECHTPDSAEIPPGVILVQPAPPECCLALDEDSRQSETSGLGCDSECHTPAAAQIPPGVILVQPAPPECCLALAEDSRQSETSRPTNLLEELSESSSVELPSHLAEDTESTDVTPAPQKRKKRNPFKRLWTWAKKTFTSRVSVDAES